MVELETVFGQSLEIILDSITDGYVVYDKDWRFVYLNKRAAELFGVSKGECIGRKLQAVFPDHVDAPMWEAFRRAIDSGNEKTIEYRSPGSGKWLSARLVPTEQGLVTYLCDLSEHKKAQADALYLETVMHSINDALISTDHEWRIISWNTGAENLYGWTAKEVIGKHAGEVIPTEGISSFNGKKEWHEALINQGWWQGEVMQRTKGGKNIQVQAYLTALKDADGKLTGAVAFNRDISEKKKAEEAQMRLAAIVESSDDAIISKNLNGIITSWNEAAEKIFGYSAEEAIGRHITLIIPEELQYEEDQIISKIKRGLRIDHFDTERLTKTGKRINISLTISPVKNSKGVIIGASKIARDITQRKKEEQAIIESENRFRILAENIQSLAWMANPDGWIFWCNQRWYEYLGKSFETIKGWGWEDTIHPEHMDRVHEFLVTAWDKGEAWEITFPLRGKDGNYRLFLTSAFPVRDSEGSLTRWIGTCTDIDDLKTTA